ncbi:MAG: hypothetical protein JW789_02830 [Candidatus Aenigmarchaeota archaeon]|nr:hypothetical protein [Candidatus Aenigmarchaeota archaeon]
MKGIGRAPKHMKLYEAENALKLDLISADYMGSMDMIKEFLDYCDQEIDSELMQEIPDFSYISQVERRAEKYGDMHHVLLYGDRPDSDDISKLRSKLKCIENALRMK